MMEQCVWALTNPDITVPATTTTSVCALRRKARSGPTPAIRSPSMTTAPCGIGSASVPVMSWVPQMAYAIGGPKGLTPRSVGPRAEPRSGGSVRAASGLARNRAGPHPHSRADAPPQDPATGGLASRDRDGSGPLGQSSPEPAPGQYGEEPHSPRAPEDPPPPLSPAQSSAPQTGRVRPPAPQVPQPPARDRTSRRRPVGTGRPCAQTPVSWRGNPEGARVR